MVTARWRVKDNQHKTGLTGLCARLKHAHVVVHERQVRHRIHVEVVRRPRVLQVVRHGGEEESEHVNVLQVDTEVALVQEHPRFVQHREGVPGGKKKRFITTSVQQKWGLNSQSAEAEE